MQYANSIPGSWYCMSPDSYCLFWSACFLRLHILGWTIVLWLAIANKCVKAEIVPSAIPATMESRAFQNRSETGRRPRILPQTPRWHLAPDGIEARHGRPFCGFLPAENCCEVSPSVMFGIMKLYSASKGIINYNEPQTLICAGTLYPLDISQKSFWGVKVRQSPDMLATWMVQGPCRLEAPIQVLGCDQTHQAGRTSNGKCG